MKKRYNLSGILVHINLEQVVSDQQLDLINHFNIFEDLFMPGVYFHNTQGIDIVWNNQQQETNPSSSSALFMSTVHFGNVFNASGAAKPPSVHIAKLDTNDQNKKMDGTGYNTRTLIIFVLVEYASKRRGGAEGRKLTYHLGILQIDHKIEEFCREK